MTNRTRSNEPHICLQDFINQSKQYREYAVFDSYNRLVSTDTSSLVAMAMACIKERKSWEAMKIMGYKVKLIEWRIIDE